MNLSLSDLLKLLLKHLACIVICAFIGLTGSFFLFKFIVHPTYASSVKLYVYTKDNQTITQQSYNNLNDLNYAQKIVNTYIEMLRTDSFYKAVKDKAALNYSTDDLKQMIDFTVLNDTEVFQISVKSHKPEDSKQIADTVTLLAPKTISEINESALLKVVDSASFPTKPSSPNIPVDCALGFIVGIAISIIYILLKEALDNRIKNEDDIILKYNIPILGNIPAFGTHSTRRILIEGDENQHE